MIGSLSRKYVRAGKFLMPYCLASRLSLILTKSTPKWSVSSSIFSSSANTLSHVVQLLASGISQYQLNINHNSRIARVIKNIYLFFLRFCEATHPIQFNRISTISLEEQYQYINTLSSSFIRTKRDRIDDHFVVLGSSRYRRRKINPLIAKFHAYRRTGLAVPSVLGRPCADQPRGCWVTIIWIWVGSWWWFLSIDSSSISTLSTWNLWIQTSSKRRETRVRRRRANRWTSPFLATTSSEQSHNGCERWIRISSSLFLILCLSSYRCSILFSHCYQKF